MAKYCKSFLEMTRFPDCIMRMVELAESHPSAAMVGAYQQSGRCVRWQGFPYPNPVMTGRELCRQIFFEGDPFIWIRLSDVALVSGRSC